MTTERLAHRVPQAAKLLDVSERHIRHLLATRQIASAKVGGCRVIPHAALLDYLARQSTTPTDLNKNGDHRANL